MGTRPPNEDRFLETQEFHFAPFVLLRGLPQKQFLKYRIYLIGYD